MTSDLTGTTAVVTGGGVGIGRSIALRLARAGARVAATYRTHQPDPELVEALGGPEAVLRRLDATSEREVAGFAAELADRFGSLDVLVNNAGGLVRRAPMAELDLDLWRTVMAVNLDSTFLVTRALLPLISRGRGRVINLASLAGQNGGGPGATAYATAKAAVLGFTRALAKEVAADGITVNALAPGFIEDTPFHETFTSAEARATTLAAIPVGRAGVPEDVAAAVHWLASGDAGFVTGAIVDLNGGAYLR